MMVSWVKVFTRLVEGNVAVGSDAAHEQVDLSVRSHFLLVTPALGLGVLGHSVQEIEIGGIYVDMGKEVVHHEPAVALGMVLVETEVLVHVEGHDVLERNLARLVDLDDLLIHAQRRRSGRQTEHERTVGGRLEIVYAPCDMVRGPFSAGGIIFLDYYVHSNSYRMFFFNEPFITVASTLQYLSKTTRSAS